MEHMEYVKEVIRPEREEARRKAIDSLSRYKFQMFGYWAAVWVTLNKLDPRPLPNPFSDFVKLARIKKEET